MYKTNENFIVEFREKIIQRVVYRDTIFFSFIFLLDNKQNTKEEK